MGMYTELVMGFRTQNPELIRFITELIEPNKIYNDRRDFMLKSSSYYFPCSSPCSHIIEDNLGYHNVSIRCSLKNYEGEIEWFIEKVKSMLEEQNGELLGYYRYEENKEPTLIYENESQEY